jgi:hypothetical protein
MLLEKLMAVYAQSYSQICGPKGSFYPNQITGLQQIFGFVLLSNFEFIPYKICRLYTIAVMFSTVLL